jgi:hypothetical protein
MQVTWKDLECAFAPIEEVGKGEVEFEVNGTTITLRRLLPEQEAEVQKFAVSTLKNEDESAGNAMDYIERFKLAVLSYALVSIGSMDLRGVDYIETNEVLTNGVVVKIPKHQALRKMFLQWSAPVRIAMFRKYSNLLAEVELKAEKAIQFDPTDLDAEILRTEERLVSLKETRDQNNEGLESEISKIVKSVVNKEDIDESGQTEDTAVDVAEVAPEVPQEVPVAEPVVLPQVVPEGPRRSSIPQAARPVQAPPQAVARPVQVREPQPVRTPDQSQYTAGMDTQDSFVDMGDASSMDEAIHAENIRMLQQRRAVQQGHPIPDSPSVLTQVHGSRTAPHLAARSVDDDDIQSEEFRHTRRTVDGVDAYQIAPPEELTSRHGAHPPASPTKIVPKGANPNFQPPKKL